MNDQARPLRLAIAGLGTVGATVARHLQSRANEFATRAGRSVVVTAVSARSRGKDRGIDLSGVRWFDDPVAMAREAEADVFAELMGGAGDPAKAAVEAALSRGLHVVTANTALLAAHGPALARLAEANGGSLKFEAAAAGGIPVIKALREAMAGNEIQRVSGIMNGTCNYILTRMEAEGLSFADCLKAAQELGYAEADPTFDVEGYDTAHKLALLTSLAFGCEVDADSIYVEGISNVTPLDLRMAEELGYRIKLLGVAERTAAGIEQRVHPTMVPRTAQLAQVMGVLNAVTIIGDTVGELTFVGPGAGGGATASAVLADIADIAGGEARPVFGKPASAMEKAAKAPMQRHEGGYYVRLTALDRRGVFAAIAGTMAEHGISLESIIQKGAPKQSTVPVILITHATTEHLIRAAVASIAEKGVLDGPPQVIRIDRA
ncbi:MAG: homoserine dehydrogenase [Beijerinckiaceae bacterium]